jgi:4-oxalocrotonate tautomerase
LNQKIDCIFLLLIQLLIYLDCVGRTDEQKKLFVEKITESAVEILQTKPEHVIVIFDENPKENWYLAGKFQ